MSEQGNITVWAGTRLKFAINASIDGVAITSENMGDDYDLRVVVSCGPTRLDLTPSSFDDAGTPLLVIDTATLGTGLVSIITYVSVKDSDFEGGYRTEVDKQDILYIKAV